MCGMDVFQKFIVFIQIVFWLIKFRGKHQAYGSLGEIIQCAPYLCAEIEPHARIAELVFLGLFAVV